MAKMFFAPNGKPITTASAYSFNSPDIEVDEVNGTSGLGPFGDFPDFSAYRIPGLGNVLMDIDANEWLEAHCRLIEVDEGYDVWCDHANAPARSEEISAACQRVARLGNTLWAVEQLRRWSPKDIAEDPTINAALNHLVVGRVQDEIDHLQAKIAAYRVGRIEPELITSDASECKTCADAIETRLLPCDECGAMDETSEETEDA